MKIDIIDALLCTQRALLGVVSPQLRAVTVDLDTEDEIFYISFFYDGEINEEVLEDWECAVTEASAGLGPDYFTEINIERLDVPKKIPVKGRLVYLRKE
jgi:hypothetical protein